MKTQNILPGSASSYGRWSRLQSKAEMIDWIKSVLGITQMKDTRKYRAAAAKDIAEIDRLLHMDGEDDWFANICKQENGKKECYPEKK